MRVLCAFLFLLLLRGECFAAKNGSDIEDRAKLFSSKALTDSKSVLSPFSGQTHYGIFIETCEAPEIPAKAKSDDAALERFLANWAIEQHKRRKLNGVYAVITKNPTYVRVQATADLVIETKGVTEADIKKWKTNLESQVAAKKYDTGLKEFLTDVSAKLDKAPKPSGKAVVDPRAKNQGESGGGGLKIWMLVIIALIVPVIVRIGMGVLAVTKIKKPAPGTRAPSTGTVFLQGMLGEALSEKFLSKPKPLATNPAPVAAPAAAASPKPASSAAAQDNSPFAAAPASKAPAAKASAPVAEEANPFAAAPASKAPAAKKPAAKPAAPIADDSNPFA